MLMLKTTHDRIVAERDAVLAQTEERAKMYAGLLKAERRHKERLNTEADEWASRAVKAEAQLAVFTTPRARNSRGHFISAKGASA